MAKASKPVVRRAAKRPAKRSTRGAAGQAAGGGAKKAKRRTRTKTGAKASAGAKRRVAKRIARPERIVRARPETLRVRSISASLTVADLERSLVLYAKGFGFLVQERWESEGKLAGVTLRAGTCEVNLSRDDGAKGLERHKGEGIRLWLETVQDLDDLAERAESYGAVVTSWPADREWGVRSFSADDLDGYHLSFFRKLE